MTAPAGESQPGPGEAITPFFAAVEEMLGSVEGYLDACTAYAGRPTKQNESALDTAVARHTDASLVYLLALAEGMTVEAFRADAIKFLMEQDDARVDALNAKLGKDSALAKRDAPPTIEDNVSDGMSDEDHKRLIAGTIAIGHSHGVVADTQFFVEEVGEDPAAQRQERRERLMEHAMDIGKAAIGGAVGAAIVLWAGRRSN